MVWAARVVGVVNRGVEVVVLRNNDWVIPGRGQILGPPWVLHIPEVL